MGAARGDLWQHQNIWDIQYLWVWGKPYIAGGMQKSRRKKHTWGLPGGTCGSIRTSMGTVRLEALDENETH